MFHETVSLFYRSWDMGLRVDPGLMLYFIAYISLLNILAIAPVLWILGEQTTVDIVRMEWEAIVD